MQKFRRNDIVSTSIHNRLMVVEEYKYAASTVCRRGAGLYIVVSEGGYYKESELKLIFRR